MLNSFAVEVSNDRPYMETSGKDMVKPLIFFLQNPCAGDYSSVRLNFTAFRKKTGTA